MQHHHSADKRRIATNLIQYPNVVQPSAFGWTVLFVRTDRPYRIAEFDSKEQALDLARDLNQSWRLEQDAWLEMRGVIFKIQEKISSNNRLGRLRPRFTKIRRLLSRMIRN